MSFGVVSVTAETDRPLTVPLSVTAVSGKTSFGRSLNTSAATHVTTASHITQKPLQVTRHNWNY